MGDPIISLPRGGGALKGIGELFAADPQTGTGNYTIPLGLPPGRNGFQPTLALSYSTGNGVGYFGLGWTVGEPAIRRRTQHGVPVFDDLVDVFTIGGVEELVRVGGAYPGTARYRARTEGSFARIEHVHTAEENYWIISSIDGLRTWYGTPKPANAPAGWSDPAVTRNRRAANRPILEWLATRTVDQFGNELRYFFEARDSGTIGAHDWDQPLLSGMAYVDHGDAAAPDFVFRVALVYEDRPDPISDYAAGFEVRVSKRCTAIRLESHTDVVRPMREWRLAFTADPWSGSSLLSRVQLLGFNDDGEAIAEMPAVELGYSALDPAKRHFMPVTGTQLPPTILHEDGVDLVDLFGSGLPDILETGGTLRYWRNLGDGVFDLPRTMASAPSLAAGATLIDANGDGRVDLQVDGIVSGVYPLGFRDGFAGSTFVPYPKVPTFSFTDPEVRLLDLTGDGITDALRTSAKFEHYFNTPGQGWATSRIVDRGPAASFPDVSFSDRRVQLADMSGDGLKDIVLIHDRNVQYWPNLGRGDWGARLSMAQAPELPLGYDPSRVLFGDLNGDGAADLVYVDNGKVLIWINQGGNAFATEPIVIPGTPPLSLTDVVTMTDLTGCGVEGILWSRPAAGIGQPTMYFLDLTGGNKPGLLTFIDGQIGAATRIDYASSTRFYLDDNKRPETRWKTPLPVPVQVVARVQVEDSISSGRTVTRYRYRHGYWDGLEREFRGFAYVEQLDTESFATPPDPILPPDPALWAGLESVHFSPPLLSKTWFHIGPVGEETGLWRELDWSSEYWSGEGAFDPSVQGCQERLPSHG